MAIKKAYTTAAKVAAYLHETIPSGAADDAINQAIDIVDTFTGRNFVATNPATARVFNGNGKQDMPIDECVEITLVERGTDEYGDNHEVVAAGGLSGYYKWPLNAAELGLPCRILRLRGRWWNCGFGNHRITAKWGFSATCPDDVSYATTVLAAGIYSENITPTSSGDIKSESIGNYSVTYADSDSSSFDQYNQAIKILSSRRIINI